ncbi:MULTISPECIES: hypothetical protein [unclassified Sphingopyxis]|uniref:hypothetical protein n=1 Tax=unclassified Sphingopyxis TaxID=2614943 RepID=UPI0028657246|nr:MULTISPECIES: hypothetical protein [unclassified Sphingopyxis]MDR6833913.1 putative anti-sigma-YlaC factor YlaD [Sphingopyxis sp. BE122]MDR7226182.1 putative anti-sigma-YlaC factor YlaD [Sphingopyxis sp. BE259]
MTLMLILGAVAAFYCLLLLFRCATYALPIFAGLGLAFTLRDQGFDWMVILAAGLLAGVSVHTLGRHLARGSAPLAVRLGVILIFVGAAAAAGYQAGAALAMLVDLDPWTQRGISILTALATGYSGWRNLLSPGGALDRPALHS